MTSAEAMNAATDGTMTDGTLLGGRVQYRQPRVGFRSGIEPVLLAASVAAKSDERVLEAGTGAGAALLCLAARVPRLVGQGIDVDASLIALATRNAGINGMTGLSFVALDILTDRLDGMFDHAFANPPFHAASGSASPLVARDRSKRGFPGLLTLWAKALSRRLRARGTLTFILPAAILPTCLAAMAEADCAPDAILPLWPKTGIPAKLIIVRGIRSGRGPMRLLPGVTLHRSDGAFSEVAEAILRDGASLDLG